MVYDNGGDQTWMVCESKSIRHSHMSLVMKGYPPASFHPVYAIAP